MLTQDAVAQRAIRHAADRIEAVAGGGRFRRRRGMERSPDGDRLVLAAAERAATGDDDALRYLYLCYADNVYGYVCAIVRDEHDAEDVTQQVFAKLPGALARYEPRVVPFAAWILRVAHNVAVDHVRARRAVPCEEIHPPGSVADSSGRERFAELRAALELLPAEQRDVLVLRFLVGLTPGEVAARLGRSEDAVHALQHRGRRRLRRELGDAAI